MKSVVKTPAFGFNIAVHITAYNDAAGLARVLAAIDAQTCAPTTIRVVDNSPVPVNLPVRLVDSVVKMDYVHLPANVGTAGAINRSIEWGRGQMPMPLPVDYLWILDQDSVPAPDLLAGLIAAHQNLAQTALAPVGIVAPLTRNRDDGQPNRPLCFDRYRSRDVLYTSEPVECDFLPASGMLLHLPSLHRLSLPADDYFLDVYDFALGLAVKAAGAGVWWVPALELSHQVGRKVTFIKNGQPRKLADMPALRVHLVQRNTTYLYTRSAHGFYKLLAAAWQGWRAFLQAWRFIYYGFDQRWSKAVAALSGWGGGVFGLKAKAKD